MIPINHCRWAALSFALLLISGHGGDASSSSRMLQFTSRMSRSGNNKSSTTNEPKHAEDTVTTTRENQPEQLPETAEDTASVRNANMEEKQNRGEQRRPKRRLQDLLVKDENKGKTEDRRKGQDANTSQADEASSAPARTKSETQKEMAGPDWLRRIRRDDTATKDEPPVRDRWPKSVTQKSTVKRETSPNDSQEKEDEFSEVEKSKPVQLSLEGAPEPHDVKRGWPAWFPLSPAQNLTASSINGTVNVRETLVSNTVVKEPKAEMSDTRGEQSLGDSLRGFRERFRQGRSVTQCNQTEAKKRGMIIEQEPISNDESPQEPNGEESSQSREEPAESNPTFNIRLLASPVFSKLQGSASNAAAFIRKLPWQPTRCEMDHDGDEEDLPVVASVRNVSLSNETRMDATRRKQRMLKGPAKLIELVVSLPWTPAGVHPSLTPCVANDEGHTDRRVSRNPVKIIRNLPWRRLRKDELNTGGSSSQNREIDEDYVLEEAMLVDIAAPIQDSNKDGSAETKTELQEEDQDKAPAGSSMGSSDFSQRASSLDEHLEAQTDEANFDKNRIESIMTSYVEREEESAGSNEDSADGTAQPSKDATEKMGCLRIDRNLVSDGSNDNRHPNMFRRSPGEPNIRALAIGRRRESEKKEKFKPIDPQEVPSDEKMTSSNTTAAQDRKDERVPETNTTSTSDLTPQQGDDHRMEQQRQQQQEQQQQEQQQQQPTMIIMGVPQGGRSMPPDMGRGPPVPSSSIILVEAIASIVSAFVRIWMITFFAKWWSEEEMLRPVQHFVWERLNDRFLRDATALQNVLQMPPVNVPERKWRRFLRRQHRIEGKVQKKQLLEARTFERTALVLEIKGELNVPHLEEAITFVLSQHREQAFGNVGGLAKELEVIVLIESPGGAVQDFGLAASQIERLSLEPGLTTTACVDKIAASGGYMIASQAHTIVAASFATVGSIGVIRENVNIHDALLRRGVKGMVLTAGESKAPLTTIGPVTNKDVAKAQLKIDSIHSAFKQLVARGRPQLDAHIEDVCDGDIYFGENAKDLGLVDRIATSEEYLLERIQAGDRVMKLHKSHQNVQKRRLFLPLDLLRDRSSPLRAACAKWIRTDLESTLSRAFAAVGVVGTIQVVAQNVGLFTRYLA